MHDLLQKFKKNGSKATCTLYATRNMQDLLHEPKILSFFQYFARFFVRKIRKKLTHERTHPPLKSAKVTDESYWP